MTSQNSMRSPSRRARRYCSRRRQQPPNAQSGGTAPIQFVPGVQRCGSSSSMQLTGCVGSPVNMSFRQGRAVEPSRLTWAHHDWGGSRSRAWTARKQPVQAPTASTLLCRFQLVFSPKPLHRSKTRIPFGGQITGSGSNGRMAKIVLDHLDRHWCATRSALQRMRRM